MSFGINQVVSVIYITTLITIMGLLAVLILGFVECSFAKCFPPEDQHSKRAMKGLAWMRIIGLVVISMAGMYSIVNKNFSMLSPMGVFENKPE